ncbi:MAG TPA: sulfatase-like hydrolase/transferase [Gammaproteobacteria bacterium]|nr:sulfatase-like hydrolase/transferase [Gammaproteobacteria bacterium]
MSTSNPPGHPEKKMNLFSTLLILTAFLILAEISFLIENSGVYFADFRLIASHLSVPVGILPGVLYFVGVQLLIHGFFTVLIWGATLLVIDTLRVPKKMILRMGVSLWFIAILTVLLANHICFPNSKFADLFFNFLSVPIAKGLCVVLSAGWIFLILLACFSAGRFIFQAIKKRQIKKNVRLLSALTGSGVFFICLLVFFHDGRNRVDAATSDKPDIILIGMDSVRPDFLGFFGYLKNTPHLDGFLNHATVFADALTPLARTYPSWVSILTGVYPKLNSIRTNLADQSRLDLSETLPAVLREEGYHTVFATDETRFSNIDQRYGFDEVVTPPIGFNDFLIGTMNDFPISNLLINTSLGKYLFPYSYGNRAVFETYDPNSFLRLLQPMLRAKRSKPTLLIVHFCLPHFPYAWERLPEKRVTLRHYQIALKRMDQQFHDFMVMLSQNKWLDHAVVVLLSDHGEAVEIPGDRMTDPDLFISDEKNAVKDIPRFYPPSTAREKVNMSGGHGTDVLGLPQYHTVLAFRTFGTKPNAIKIIPGIVSLMDIKPTLLTFLNLPLGRGNGNPLEDYIFGDKNAVDTQEDFFTESDFSPEAVRSIYPDERKVLFEGIDYFRIDPKTTRIVVKDNMMRMILSSKQFADYYGQWVLALYPQNNKVMMPVLVNLKTGYWTMDLNSEFAKDSPAHRMLRAMEIFFGSDITTVEAG